MSDTNAEPNAPGSPDGEPRFRIAHLVRDPALRIALKTAEDVLGPLPELPKNKEIAAAGSDSAKNIFHQAFLEAKIERARWDVAEAEFCVVLLYTEGKELADFQAARTVATGRLRKALVRLAGLPAMSPTQLGWKKDMIGKAWLSTDSVFSDPVARDEAYLATKTAARARAKL